MEYVKVYSHQCGLTLYPNNDIEHPHLDFGSNIEENNHSLSCEHKVEICVDHVFPSCVLCGKEDISLDTPKSNRLMYKDFLKGKELVRKG